MRTSGCVFSLAGRSVIELAGWEQSPLFMRTALAIVATMSVVTVKTGHAIIL